MEAVIKGVGVNLDSADVKNAKTIEELKALDILSHLLSIHYIQNATT